MRDVEPQLSLEQLDRDGALRETATRAGVTRAGLVRSTLVGSAAFLTALTCSEDGAGATPRRDVDILNYALVLEELQSAFYTEAERLGALRGKTAQAGRVLGAVERAHVKALRGVLGGAAVAKPGFDFQGVTEQQRPFLKTAVAFEDLAVAAYKGQAPRIATKALLAAAVSIHSVEARHAAWMRHLFGIVPAEKAFDDALPMREVQRIVASTRFIASRPKTSKAGETPRFTG